MISVTNLKKAYKGINAVNIENLHFDRGEVIGLVGNNGAGKTTFFRLLLDLIRSDEGEVRSKSNLVTRSEDWKSAASVPPSISSPNRMHPVEKSEEKQIEWTGSWGPI